MQQDNMLHLAGENDMLTSNLLRLPSPKTQQNQAICEEIDFEHFHNIWWAPPTGEP